MSKLTRIFMHGSVLCLKSRYMCSVSGVHRSSAFCLKSKFNICFFSENRSTIHTCMRTQLSLYIYSNIY